MKSSEFNKAGLPEGLRPAYGLGAPRTSQPKSRPASKPASKPKAKPAKRAGGGKKASY